MERAAGDRASACHLQPLCSLSRCPAGERESARNADLVQRAARAVADYRRRLFPARQKGAGASSPWRGRVNPSRRSRAGRVSPRSVDEIGRNFGSRRSCLSLATCVDPRCSGPSHRSPMAEIPSGPRKAPRETTGSGQGINREQAQLQIEAQVPH